MSINMQKSAARFFYRRGCPCLSKERRKPRSLSVNMQKPGIRLPRIAKHGPRRLRQKLKSRLRSSGYVLCHDGEPLIAYVDQHAKVRSACFLPPGGSLLVKGAPQAQILVDQHAKVRRGGTIVSTTRAPNDVSHHAFMAP